MIFNGTRLGSFIQTLLYLTGVPILKQNSDINSVVRSSNGNGQSIVTYTTNINNLVSTPHPTDPKNIMCYGILGCIRVKYPSERGFHLFPESLTIIKPTICLQLNNERQCQYIELDTIKRMLRGPGIKSYWITHGYIETNRLWIQKMVNTLLDYDNNANVFTIDWSRGAQPPYRQAVVNIELLGAYIGQMMTIIEEVHGLKTNDVHFIGHSLGSHLGGFAGSWLNRKELNIGRITGLDPAQPYFESFPIDVRLDPTDAFFVDVIHTDAKPLWAGGSLSGLGTQEPCGHVDFYPNNGKDQPGCSDGVYQAIIQEQGSFLYGLRRFIGCDHIRAYEYFTESILSNCSFMAYSCPSWDSFYGSKCNEICDGALENCNTMGFHAKLPKSGRSLQGDQFWSNGFNESILTNGSILYYSMTGTRSPYCREHYLVTLKLDGISSIKTNSNLNLLIFGKNGIIDRMTLGARDLRGGISFYYTLASHHLKEPIKKIIINPTVTNSIWWLVNRVTKSLNIKIDSITIKSLETFKEKKVCSIGKSLLNLSDKNSNVILTKSACSMTIEQKNNTTRII